MPAHGRDRQSACTVIVEFGLPRVDHYAPQMHLGM